MRFLASLILLTTFARAEVDTAPLRAWLAEQSKTTALQADFIQQRTLPALKKPTSTPGTLTIVRPGKLRWDLGQPAKTIAVSDGTTMTLVDVAKQEARTMPSDSARAKQFTLLADGALGGSMEAFTDAFELIESRVTNGIYQLTTKPKDRSLRSRVPWVFFDIDPRGDELRALEVQLDDKSRIRTIFSNTRINPSVPSSRFQIDLSGYKVK